MFGLHEGDYSYVKAVYQALTRGCLHSLHIPRPRSQKGCAVVGLLEYASCDNSLAYSTAPVAKGLRRGGPTGICKL